MIILDGGMGTLLQARGLKPGDWPEDWNIERPEDVADIHRAYAAAGSQVVYANTFGANRLKYHGKYGLKDVISAAIANARRAGVRVALDVGPTGRLLKPAGDLDFNAAVEAFSEQVRLGNEAGADLVVVETMGDLLELKAAVVAAREVCRLPVWATVALDEGGKLLTGGSVECVAALLESLEVEAYGFNCGLGPDRMLPFVERLAKVSSKPLIVKPNAGLPKVVDGKTIFSVGPDEFVREVKRLVAAGASIVGGCCGTTPAHIGKVSNRRIVESSEAPLPDSTIRRFVRFVRFDDCKISSGTSVVELKPHAGLIVGERINPTGKRLLKEAFARGDTAYVLREAVKQVEAGAEVLDINCGVPGMDEAALLESTLLMVQGVVTCPLQIDTADPAALARALRQVNGKALVNSVNGKRESMQGVFPVVKKYGGTIVALCLDENGIPPTAEGRLDIARRILSEGEKWGFGKSDFVFDALTLSVSADPQAAVVTLETVRRLTEELGVNTILGVSNVSFGLPNRPALNNAMYALAKQAGLSAAIANPSAIRDEIDPGAEDVLMGRDANCARWIEINTEAQRHREVWGQGLQIETDRLANSVSLYLCVKKGLKDDARVAAEEELKSGVAAMDVIEKGIVPALEDVGRGFEKGTVYLPQLLMSADAAGAAFAVVKGAMSSVSSLKSSRVSCFPSQVSGFNTGEDFRHGTLDEKKPIVLATVKGDVHDIGKNIVRALLENYGFDVIDLGKDVPPEKVVETVRKTGAKLVGLSALMTTTVGAMAETIRRLKDAGLACRTVVGGAVVTQEYADSIGADFYAKDAMHTVRIAESLGKL